MARGMLRVAAVIVAILLLLSIIYYSTAPASAQLHVSTFADHEGESIDWSYGVIIDAGSTGSRLFLYRWHAVSDERLIDIHPALDETNRAVVKKANPGLSTFADNPENATGYLKPLLDHAVKYVPASKLSYTPIFIFATAGMRLLPVKQQEAIMNNLRTNLPLVTPMQVISDHIRVIEGKWEGIYSWIAVNYILGRFNVNESSAIRSPTVGMVDVGGASLQIAVELNKSDNVHSSAVEIVNLGCRDGSDLFRYRVFVTTFLGYGVNEGLRKYEQLLGDKLLTENSTVKAYVRDSCLPTNLVKTVSRKNGSRYRVFVTTFLGYGVNEGLRKYEQLLGDKLLTENSTVKAYVRDSCLPTNLVKTGVGDWDACVGQLSELVVNSGTNAECQKSTCYLGQVVAPQISLSDIELYGFSECWFSTEDVFSLGGPYNFTLLAAKARDFCKLRWSTIQSRSRLKLYPKADEDRLRSQCFKSAWIAAVLHTGFSLDKSKNRFRSVFDVNGEEVQWTLGAMLYNMRYFPLRDMQRRNLLDKRRRESTTSRGSIYILLGAAACFILVVILQRCRHVNRGFLRREPSIWGYMMLSQDQLYPLQYKVPSFS
ncbi:Nucleoside-diphosphatase mig-23 [Toxocara canis]|uniref:Nucleoside-diphosphatase mig-23 n=1 Tax=Toxocara canis TaxID=6265 RepID=A0A0B2VCP4_TOXCA|nr:Nucleoside-diphosphatase mig-23 [Toxocara canis]